jgi:hypothetical protein
MANLYVFPGKIVNIDDEDFERLSAYQWRVVPNVAGKVGRRLPSGKAVGLAAELIGKRPSASKRLAFKDKDLRNFSKSNIRWSNDCIYCGRPMHSLLTRCTLYYSQEDHERRMSRIKEARWFPPQRRRFLEEA